MDDTADGSPEISSGAFPLTVLVFPLSRVFHEDVHPATHLREIGVETRIRGCTATTGLPVMSTAMGGEGLGAMAEEEGCEVQDYGAEGEDVRGYGARGEPFGWGEGGDEGGLGPGVGGAA